MARALIAVDVQMDFCPGGALGVPDGDAVVPRVNALARSGAFDLVVATRDWHPIDHNSFCTADPPGPWPVHCVQNTPGAELHPGLDREPIDIVIDKGIAVDTEGYSGFDATQLASLFARARDRRAHGRRLGDGLLRARHGARRASGGLLRLGRAGGDAGGRAQARRRKPRAG